MHCSHCGSLIGRGQVSCPSCGAAQSPRAQVASGVQAPPPPMPPPRVEYATPMGMSPGEYVRPAGVSGLGVAAIALGGVALLFAWIPFCGAVVAWPVGLIGLILGVIGWAVAHHARQGLAVPVTGTVLCVVALLVPLAMWSYVVRQANTAQQRMQQTTPWPTTPATPANPAATPTSVTHPGTLTVGDFRVRMTDGELREDRVVLVLDVRNTAPAPVDFELYAQQATLKDDLNNRYGARVDVERAARATTTVPPNGSNPYTFEFDALQPPAQRLILSIPANGQWHTLTIPRTALRKAD